MHTELIRNQLIFAGLSDHDITWLADHAELIEVEKGELLMEEGSPGDSFYVVIEGEFQVTKRTGNSEVVLAVRGAGEMFGELSILQPGGVRTASARALRDSQLFKINKSTFNELIATRPSATLAILRTVITRLRNTEGMLRQSEKMASLGTLAAGLAHELNNPAAAAKRSSAQLAATLNDVQTAAAELGTLGLNPAQTKIIDGLSDEIKQRAGAPPVLAPLERSDRENDLQTWLEDQSIDQAWELAPVLVSFGWDQTFIAAMSAHFAPKQFAVIVRWLCVGCTAFSLLDEVNQSAQRISEIVQAVKSYSYLDQAPIQLIDVHQGLESTLTILRGKLKAGVVVQREYATDLPKIQAYGSELNQVWTNIIDNAIDAMQSKGEITLKTFRVDENRVGVEITDNGPGIPPEIQSRIFDPFFTTKPPGIGTGLGLNISYNIIQKHRGQISVQSQPGKTAFHVELPINQVS